MSRHMLDDGSVRPSFVGLMVALAEATGAKLTTGRIRTYAQEFDDVPWDAFVEACGRARRECQFFPSIPEIRRHLTPSPDDQALLAWTALNRAATEIGAWYDVEFEDGAARQALLDVFGSWAAFCELPDGPGLAIKRQEFLAAYRQARRLNAAPGAAAGRLAAFGEAKDDRLVATIGPSGIAIRRSAALPPAVEKKRIGAGDAAGEEA